MLSRELATEERESLSTGKKKKEKSIYRRACGSAPSPEPCIEVFMGGPWIEDCGLLIWVRELKANLVRYISFQLVEEPKE